MEPMGHVGPSITKPFSVGDENILRILTVLPLKKRSWITSQGSTLVSEHPRKELAPGFGCRIGARGLLSI